MSATTELKKMGRPIIPFDPDLAKGFIEWVASGRALANLPEIVAKQISITTIYKWMDENADFSAAVARARVDSADTLVDQTLAIALNLPEGADNAAVRRAEMQINTMRWIASRLKPQAYGEKLDVNMTGNVTLALSDAQLNAKLTRLLGLASGGPVIENIPAISAEKTDNADESTY